MAQIVTTVINICIPIYTHNIVTKGQEPPYNPLRHRVGHLVCVLIQEGHARVESRHPDKDGHVELPHLEGDRLEDDQGQPDEAGGGQPAQHHDCQLDVPAEPVGEPGHHDGADGGHAH